MAGGRNSRSGFSFQKYEYNDVNLRLATFSGYKNFKHWMFWMIHHLEPPMHDRPQPGGQLWNLICLLKYRGFNKSIFIPLHHVNIVLLKTHRVFVPVDRPGVFVS